MKIEQFRPNGERFPSRSRAGMTLVEVIMAMAITGLTVAAIVKGYAFSTMSAERAALALAANARALERIEETRSAKWDAGSWPVVDRVIGANFPSKVVILDLSGSGVGITTATIQTAISQISTNPSLKRIRVDCVWVFKGQSVTNTIETCRAPD